MRSFFRLTQVDPGFNARNTDDEDVAPALKNKDGAAAANFYRHFSTRFRRCPCRIGGSNLTPPAQR